MDGDFLDAFLAHYECGRFSAPEEPWFCEGFDTAKPGQPIYMVFEGQGHMPCSREGHPLVIEAQ